MLFRNAMILVCALLLPVFAHANNDTVQIEECNLANQQIVLTAPTQVICIGDLDLRNTQIITQGFGFEIRATGFVEQYGLQILPGAEVSETGPIQIFALSGTGNPTIDNVAAEDGFSSDVTIEFTAVSEYHPCVKLGQDANLYAEVDDGTKVENQCQTQDQKKL